MTSFKFLGAALVFSVLLATPALAWDPGNAEAADPTFSIYSGMGGVGVLANELFVLTVKLGVLESLAHAYERSLTAHCGDFLNQLP